MHLCELCRFQRSPAPSRGHQSNTSGSAGGLLLKAQTPGSAGGSSMLDKCGGLPCAPLRTLPLSTIAGPFEGPPIEYLRKSGVGIGVCGQTVSLTTLACAHLEFFPTSDSATGRNPIDSVTQKSLNPIAGYSFLSKRNNNGLPILTIQVCGSRLLL